MGESEIFNGIGNTQDTIQTERLAMSSTPIGMRGDLSLNKPGNQKILAPAIAIFATGANFPNSLGLRFLIYKRRSLN